MSLITEKSVSALWVSGRLSCFNDDSGHRIDVICPGRVSTRGGCDFQDVVIRVDGEKTVGDVEVHLTSDLWQRHGHHRDTSYNGVILHVSMWQRGLLPVRLQDGRVLSTVILGQYFRNNKALANIIYPGQARRCPHLTNSTKKTDHVIVEAGLERFEIKAAGFARAISSGGPEQALYRGICRALGYARNTRPFESLAGMVTLDTVRIYAGASLPAKYDLLLGAAGFSSELNTRLPPSVHPLKESDWAIAATRPLNHPAIRIAGLCHVLQRYEKDGLISGLVDLVGNAPPRVAVNMLDSAFKVEEDGRIDSQVLIGTGRAREIVVNAVLPFFRAYGAGIDDNTLAERAAYIYSSYPSLLQNELTRYMSGLLGNQAFGACRQQGLLHIYHTWCRTRECAACPVVTQQKTARV